MNARDKQAIIMEICRTVTEFYISTNCGMFTWEIAEEMKRTTGFVDRRMGATLVEGLTFDDDSGLYFPSRVRLANIIQLLRKSLGGAI